MSKRKTSDDWRRKEQDPDKYAIMERIADILSIAGIICAWVFYLYHTWLCLAGFIMLLLTMYILILCFPAYYTFMPVDHEKELGPQNAISFFLFFIGSSVALFLGNRYTVEEKQAFLLLTLTGVLTVCFAGILIWRSKDVNDAGCALVTILFTGILCYCIVSHANVAFNFTEQNHYETIVVDVYSSGTYKYKNYNCVVRNADGEELSVCITRGVYNQIEVDNRVCLDTYSGALGVQFYEVHTNY